MQTDATLVLSGICLGIAIAGLTSIAVGRGCKSSRLYLRLVYCVFAGVFSLPLITAFAPALYLFYFPAILIMLLTLAPAIFYYVVAKSPELDPIPFKSRDSFLPLTGCIVTIGFWLLSLDAKTTMLIEGDLPTDIAPNILAFTAFALILLWPIASLAYLIATLRRLRSYRETLRTIYSNIDQRDLRWVNWFMGFLVALWGAGTIGFTGENFGKAPPFEPVLFYLLAAGVLIFLNIFASLTPPPATHIKETAEIPDKYSRSALSKDHMESLAARIEKSMQQDALYLDPNLSLQKLSRYVGALPNHISQTLNDQIGSTFFDYVAHWRIEASKSLLKSSDASVLSVALEVGFNSKSTFYKAFGRETGLSPNQYRKAGTK